MWAFGTIRLFIKPQLVETIVSRFHEGMMQGADEPQGISNMLWSLAFLGYAPPVRLLQDFKVSIFKTCLVALCSCCQMFRLWSLAFLGCAPPVRLLQDFRVHHNLSSCLPFSVIAAKVSKVTISKDCPLALYKCCKVFRHCLIHLFPCRAPPARPLHDECSYIATAAQRYLLLWCEGVCDAYTS